MSTPTPSKAPTKTTITIAQAFKTRGFDPHVGSTAYEEQAVINNVFDTLVGRDPATMAPAPRLATSWRMLDSTTWEFRLRTDVKFHNGERFDADVVKFNVQRIQDPATKSYLTTTTGRVIKAVEVVDPATVRIVTNGPDAVLTERLAAFWLVPPKYTQDKGPDALVASPVGTGPYRFMSWDKATTVTLERSGEYFGGEPGFKTAVFRTIAEPATALAELLAQGVDVIDGVPADTVETVNKSGVARLVSIEGTLFIWIRVDALGRGGDTPLKDVRVRRAANMAVDRASLLKNLQGGYGKQIATPVTPVCFGYDPSIQPYPYDPARAKSLLQEANYPSSRELTFALYPLSGFRDHKPLVESLAASLGEVGMKVKVVSLDSGQVASLRTSGKLGDFSPSGGGLPFFDAVGSFNSFRKGNTSAYYYSDALEDLIQQAEKEVDQQKRKTILSRAQQRWFEDAGGIPLFTTPFMLGVNKGVDIKLTADWPQTPLMLMRPTV